LCLRAFFERTDPGTERERKELFVKNDLVITHHKKFDAEFGRYPVVYLGMLTVTVQYGHTAAVLWVPLPYRQRDCKSILRPYFVRLCTATSNITCFVLECPRFVLDHSIEDNSHTFAVNGGAAVVQTGHCTAYGTEYGSEPYRTGSAITITAHKHEF
jgi:hypothetical protein